MSASYQIHPVSESTNFLPINIAATSAASPTLIHTAHATNYDELWLNAYNYSAEDTLLTICFGGINAYQQMSMVIPSSRGMMPVMNGLRFTGSVQISAYASVTNRISIIGSINRIIFI